MLHFIIDLIALIICGICFLYGWKKGFFRSLVNMLGSILLFLTAFLGAKISAPRLYEKFVGPYFADKINLYITNVGTEVRMESVVINALSKIPSFCRNMLLSGSTQDQFVETIEKAANNQVDQVADLLVYDFLPAVLIPLMQGVLFLLLIFILFFLLRGLILLLGNHVSQKGLIGRTDSLIGGICGIGVSVILLLIIAYLVHLIIGFTSDSLSWCNTDVMNSTWIFRLFYRIVDSGMTSSL